MRISVKISHCKRWLKRDIVVRVLDTSTISHFRQHRRRNRLLLLLTSPEHTERLTMKVTAKLPLLLAFVGLSRFAWSACLTEDERGTLITTKEVFAGLTILRAFGIQGGTTDPLANYDWEDAVLVNWRIIPGKVNDLEAQIGLPANMHLVQTGVVESDQPAYVLTLAAKKVNVALSEVGTVPSTQLDWMVTVQTEGEQKPKLMIIQSVRDFEDVSLVAPFVIPPSDVVYNADDQGAFFQLNEPGTALTVSLDNSLATAERIHPDYVSAFGQLCWPNNVCSTIYSNGLFANSQVLVSGRNSQRMWDVTENTQWSTYIQPVPLHLVSFTKTIPFGLKVWTNVEEPARAIRNAEYFDRTFQEYLEVLQKLREPSLLFTVAGSIDVPTYYINFRVPEIGRAHV